MKRELILLGVLGAAGALSACADEPVAYYAPPPPLPPLERHVRWCFAHHPGYDPRSNLYPAPDGRLYVCRYTPPPGYFGPPPPYPPPPPTPYLPPG